MSRDLGYPVDRCLSGKSAAQALATTSGERSYWTARERFWDEQLTFARKRQEQAEAKNRG